MAIASKVFILVSVMNLFMFVLASYGGISGPIGPGYVAAEGDMFDAGLIGEINVSAPTAVFNSNASDENSFIADIENNIELNSGFAWFSFG